MINVHDVLVVVQRTLMLLGNDNELIFQARGCNILRSVGQGLEKYGKKHPTNNQEHLFGSEFCFKLKGQVESDKALSQPCHRWYNCLTTISHMTRRLVRPPWVAVRSSFFDKALPATWGPGRALLPHPTNSLLSTTSNILMPTLNSPNPGNSREDWQNCKQTSVATVHFPSTQPKLAPFFSACINPSSQEDCIVPRELVKTDQRPLGTVCHPRVSDSPKALARETQVSNYCQGGTAAHFTGRGLQAEGEGSSSASGTVKRPHSQPNLHCSQKWRKLETDYRPEVLKLSHGTATLKMEGLYMLPSIVSHKWLMGKLDLKDAYLTIPVAPDSWNLLTFQDAQPNNLMQFRCLPFRRCTTPFAFSKVTIYLLKGYKASNTVPSPVGNSSNHLPRRFIVGSSHK